jgi:hypothetical protein
MEESGVHESYIQGSWRIGRLGTKLSEIEYETRRCRTRPQKSRHSVKDVDVTL